MLKLMNSAMMPTEGRYTLKRITEGAFAEILKTAESFESSIGYQQTADYIEKISGVKVPVSRNPTTLADGDYMLIIKLAYRVADPATKGQPQPEDYEFFLASYAEWEYKNSVDLSETETIRK